MKTQVGITFGGKDLDCELEYDGRHSRDNYEFTLVKVEMVMVMGVAFGDVHTEDITDFLEWCGKALDEIENKCIEAIQERGYV